MACLLTLFILSSCGTQHKVLRAGAGSRSIPTDASDARGKVLSGSGINKYAVLLDVSPRELKNKTLYAFIDRWLGSPHRMGGMKPSGIDCSGFVSIMYQQVYGGQLPRVSRDMGAKVKKKREKKLKEGDLVFFSFGGRQIDHVGVYLHNSKFVHVSTRKGVIISNLTDSWYHKYYVRGGTPKI